MNSASSSTVESKDKTKLAPKSAAKCVAKLAAKAAASSAANRLRMGNMKHIVLIHLFLNKLLRRNLLCIEKTGTATNRAGICTTWLTGPRVRQIMWLIGLLSDEEHEDKGGVTPLVMQKEAMMMFEVNSLELRRQTRLTSRR